jgi:phosphopantetheinyl transferase
MSSAAPQLFCCRVADIDAALLARYEHLLSDEERQRLAGFQASTARTTFLISRALLRTALATRLNVAPETLQFIRDSDDKPQLAPPFADWHFNLSHSNDWVVLALSNCGPVGVDVEGHGRRNNLSGIARRFFSAAENASLADLDGQQWLQQFFAIWTLKEAHGKALGTGLAKILSCCSIEVDTGAGTIEWSLSDAAIDEGSTQSFLYLLEKNVSLAFVQLFGEGAEPPSLHLSIPLSREEPLALIAAARGDWHPLI